MPRSPRLDYPGLLHHVLVRGIERKTIFRDNKDRDYFLDQLQDVLKLSGGAKVYAWALMPNHVHMLILVSQMPLKSMMRRLLTRHAAYFNRRHKRFGHLFQNRYKSLVVDRDSYFLELIRYIHLNPIHSHEVKDLDALNHYSYTGHSALVGHTKRPWQEIGHTLREFGPTPKIAISSYMRFLEEGIKQEKRPDLSKGGIANMMNLDDSYTERDRFDERVLGGGTFVDEVLRQAEAGESQKTKPLRLKELMNRISDNQSDIIKELLEGSKRSEISEIRNRFCCQAVKNHGYKVSEVADILKINASSVSRALTKHLVNVKQ